MFFGEPGLSCLPGGKRETGDGVCDRSVQGRDLESFLDDSQKAVPKGQAVAKA